MGRFQDCGAGLGYHLGLRPIILRTSLTLELYPRGHQHSLSFWNFQLSDAPLYWWESILKNSKVPTHRKSMLEIMIPFKCLSLSLSQSIKMILFTSRRINWLKEEKKKRIFPFFWLHVKIETINDINDKRIWYMKTKWQQKQTTKESHVKCATTIREAS
jgi:hypothetical protein